MWGICRDYMRVGLATPRLRQINHSQCRRQFVVLLLFIAGCVAPISSLADQAPEQVIFAGDASYPPFEWLEAGKSVGFNVDLAKAITDMSATRLEYRLGDWPEIVAALEDGEVDVVPMFASAERNENFLFTSPFYYITHSIYAPENATPVYVAKDLAGHRVAVEERSYAHQQLSARHADITTVLTPNTVEALQAVAQGKADYAVLATPTANSLLHELRLPLKRLGPSLWPTAYVFAVRKDRADLLHWLQNAFDLAIGTGHYQRVHEKWKNELETSDINDHRRAQRIASSVALGLLLLTVAVFAWSWSLRRRVQARTQELQGALQRTRAAESHSLHLSNYDADTGLAKPHCFITLVDQALADSSTQAGGGSSALKELLIVKLGQLNGVVQLLGNDYSEELIKNFAQKIRDLSGGPCGYLGRGVFAVYSDKENVEKLFKYLLDQWNTGRQGLYSHIVGGSAYYPDHGKSGAELVQRAETALAVSRATRRRWAIYSPSMEPDTTDLEIVSAFRAEPLEGLYAVYQPQLDLNTGKIAGAEALVRWKHPTLGVMPPVRFIPIIEKAGLVSRVTALMIDEAVRLSAHLRRDGLTSAISVNITMSDLTETDLPRVVENALSSFSGNAGDLKLELTETSVASDFKYVKDVLHRLHEIGVSISVDDFGTGYSSLSYLSFFPIHEVKIDRDFVCDMVSNPRNRSIVRSTILMANELGLQTVAEGAEDRATLDMLAEQGCDRVQGFVLSKPLPETAFRTFLEKHANGGLYNPTAMPQTRLANQNERKGSR